MSKSDYPSVLTQRPAVKPLSSRTSKYDIQMIPGSTWGGFTVISPPYRIASPRKGHPDTTSIVVEVRCACGRVSTIAAANLQRNVHGCSDCSARAIQAPHHVARRVQARLAVYPHFSAFGESPKSLKALSKDPRCVVKYGTLNQRVSRYGYSIEEAMTRPLRGVGCPPRPAQRSDLP